MAGAATSGVSDPEKTGLQELQTTQRLGHVARPQMDALYGRADVDLCLPAAAKEFRWCWMEAMTRGKIVLAPGDHGHSGDRHSLGKQDFSTHPGAAREDFVAKILFLERLMCREDRNAVSQLDWIRHAAQVQVLHNFNRTKNLRSFWRPVSTTDSQSTPPN